MDQSFSSMFKSIFLSCCIILSCFSNPFACNAVANDAAEMLNRTTTYYSSLRSVRFQLQQNRYQIGGTSKPDATKRLVIETSSVIAWEASGRFAEKSTSQSSGKEYKNEVVYDGNRFVSASTDPEFPIALESSTKPSWTRFEQARKISTSSAGFLLGFHRGEFLGKKKGLEPLCEVLKKKGSLRQIDEDIFESTQEGYVVRVKCDPQRDFAPSRIEYRLIKPPGKNDPRTVEEVSIEVLAFGEFDGRPFPIEMVTNRRVSEGIEFDGELHPASTSVTQGKLSSVKINEGLTDADFTFDLPVPDYTPVQMLDAHALRFYWLKGDIVPATDEEAGRIAKSAALKKIERKGFWQRYGWVIGVASVCIVLIAVLDQVRRNRN
jgi:outer membrane lipoprotein-sorting protein